MAKFSSEYAIGFKMGTIEILEIIKNTEGKKSYKIKCECGDSCFLTQSQIYGRRSKNKSCLVCKGTGTKIEKIKRRPTYKKKKKVVIKKKVVSNFDPEKIKKYKTFDGSAKGSVISFGPKIRIEKVNNYEKYKHIAKSLNVNNASY